MSRYIHSLFSGVRTLILAGLLLALSALWSPAGATPWPSGYRATKYTQVIVTLRTPVRQETGKARSRSARQEAALRRMGADVYRHLPLIHALAVRIPTHRL